MSTIVKKKAYVPSGVKIGAGIGLAVVVMMGLGRCSRSERVEVVAPALPAQMSTQGAVYAQRVHKAPQGTDWIENEVMPDDGDDSTYLEWTVIEGKANWTVCAGDKSNVEEQFQDMQGNWSDTMNLEGTKRWRYRSNNKAPQMYMHRFDTSRLCDTPA